MKAILYKIVDYIAIAHNRIMSLNNAYEFRLSDKELHFVVIGIIGMILFFVVNPLFKALAKKDMIHTISWIYSLTLIIVLTFAIEIGQHITHTGNMEFADIAFGVVGFIFIYLIYAVIRGIIVGIAKLLFKKDQD